MFSWTDHDSTGRVVKEGGQDVSRCSVAETKCASVFSDLSSMRIISNYIVQGEQYLHYSLSCLPHTPPPPWVEKAAMDTSLCTTQRNPSQSLAGRRLMFSWRMARRMERV